MMFDMKVELMMIILLNLQNHGLVVVVFNSSRSHAVVFMCRYVKVHLIPLDAGRACVFYCCTALEPQSQMSFNEGFCIPVPTNALAVCALQLSVCSLGPQAQEELLVGLKG